MADIWQSSSNKEETTISLHVITKHVFVVKVKSSIEIFQCSCGVILVEIYVIQISFKYYFVSYFCCSITFNEPKTIESFLWAHSFQIVDGQ